MFFVFSYWFTAVGLPGCSHFGLQLVRVVLLVPKSLLRWSPDLQWGLQTRTRTTFTYCSPRWWSWCSSAGSQSLRRLSSKHFANENICLDKCIKFSLIKNTCRNHWCLPVQRLPKAAFGWSVVCPAGGRGEPFGWWDHGSALWDSRTTEEPICPTPRRQDGAAVSIKRV